MNNRICDKTIKITTTKIKDKANDNLGFAVLPGILPKDRPVTIVCVRRSRNAVTEILGGLSSAEDDSR